jgi:hypothetical protein
MEHWRYKVYCAFVVLALLASAAIWVGQCVGCVAPGGITPDLKAEVKAQVQAGIGNVAVEDKSAREAIAENRSKIDQSTKNFDTWSLRIMVGGGVLILFAAVFYPLVWRPIRLRGENNAGYAKPGAGKGGHAKTIQAKCHDCDADRTTRIPQNYDYAADQGDFDELIAAAHRAKMAREQRAKSGSACPPSTNPVCGANKAP